MPKKILLVEDDRKILDVMRRYLENRGFSVVFTDNGSEALMLVRDSKPDLIVATEAKMRIIAPRAASLEATDCYP